MKKFCLCVSLVLTGLMTSCVDKYEEVDADSKPSWLGGSIYAELKNPENNEKLTGTFTKYYLRLVDDLGYAETLNRTGSKTVFPANDEAFERFFASNEWGVRSYEELSDAQKKLLLYSSMLDNALMLGMLPNISNGTAEPTKGQAIKHMTNVSVIDTVQYIRSAADMPRGNRYWEKYYDRGIHVVNDGTRPMMVHLTREYMLNNNITMQGDDSDFAIITGTPYTDGSAYIFNDRVLSSDVICQNGYIHQMEDVIVPPGNMGQVLRKMEDARLFDRILNYLAVPVYDATVTKNYNDWAVANGKSQIDSIYGLRYLSLRSAGSGDRQVDNRALNVDPLTGIAISKNNILNFDVSIRDIGAMFVPDDDAVWDYFQPGHNGAYLIDIYGDRPNTLENLPENLDSIQSKNPQVLPTFARNLMKASFAGAVPSKFASVTNDASENMGLTIDKLKQTDGRYDIVIANNGVVYKLREMIAPDEYQAVMAPASVYPDMQVMNWAIQDGVKTGDYLGVDFKYYLLAMSANYAFFIPEDPAFDLYYLDPASLGKVDAQGKSRPELLHFYADSLSVAKQQQPYVKCYRYYCDPTTLEPYGTGQEVDISLKASQMVDILNYHTLVLPSGERIGDNHYYPTKHGGTIYVDGHQVGGRVMAGEQYEENPLFPAPRIKEIYNQKNGYTYRLDRVIQPPHQSVFGVLNSNSRFAEFLALCQGFEATDLMEWADISSIPSETTGQSEQDGYTVFIRDYRTSPTKSISDACLDYNVKMFNTYNYTLFAPNNEAMNEAYADGLPRWTAIQALFNKYKALEADHEVTAQEKADKKAAKTMMTQIRDFVRYHFVTNSVYADNHIDGGRFQTLSSDATGVAKEVNIGGGDGVMTVTDGSGRQLSINAADRGAKVVNKMTRDYWFNASRKNATGIVTSSFCAVHEISSPLCANKDGRFDNTNE